MTKKISKQPAKSAAPVNLSQCDYMRSNGKCGRGLSEMYGKVCPGGRTACADWKNEAYEAEEEKANGCVGEGADAMTVAVAPASRQLTPSTTEAVDAFRTQLANLAIAEGTAYRERVKLGVMLLQWEAYLGDGRGHGDSEGLKGWLEKNLPELGYKTAQSYKDQALKTVRLLGGGEMAKAALLGESQVTQPDGEVVEVDAKIIETRDDLYAHVDSRRKLEQEYFKFMAGEAKAKGGRPKASDAPIAKLSKKDEAKAIWNQFLQAAAKSSVKDSIPLLPAKETQIAYDDLMDLCKMLKEHLKEF